MRRSSKKNKLTTNVNNSIINNGYELTDGKFGEQLKTQLEMYPEPDKNQQILKKMYFYLKKYRTKIVIRNK